MKHEIQYGNRELPGVDQIALARLKAAAAQRKRPDDLREICANRIRNVVPYVHSHFT